MMQTYTMSGTPRKKLQQAAIVTIVLLAVSQIFVSMASASPQEVARNMVENYIVPHYAALRDAAADSAIAIDAMCASPSQAGLDDAREHFTQLVDAHGRIDFIRFGPVLADNRVDRILFWPDRQGIALRQVQQVLGTMDDTALTVQSLMQKSVAVQGLGALEFVLFGTGSDDLAAPSQDQTQNQETFRCAYGRTIAQTIAQTADAVWQDWTQSGSIADRMMSPDQSFTDYRTADEVMSELIGIFAFGAELTRDTRLRPMLRDDHSNARAKSALFWRSGLTFAHISATAQGLEELLSVSMLDGELSETFRWAAGSLQFELQNLDRTAQQLGESDFSNGATIVTQQDGWDRAAYMMIVSDSVSSIINTLIAPDLGLALGFSSLDGD